MPATPLLVPTRPVTPAPYGLLETITPEALPSHGGLAGVEYDGEFCGVARPWTAPCVTPDLGTISISVSNTKVATVAASGTPAGAFFIHWGDGNMSAPFPLNGATHTYAAAGTYSVTIEQEGFLSTGTVTVAASAATGPFAFTSKSLKVADDGLFQVTGVPTPLYHLFSCRLVGISTADAEARAVRSLDLGSSRALEEGFGQTIGAGAVDMTPTPGTPVGVVKALALLEQYGGANYAGRRVIHVSLDVLTVLISQHLIREVSGHLETNLGSLVIAGPGYGGLKVPSVPAAGSSWMYATGAVHVWRGDAVITGIVPDYPFTNEFKALVERIYVPTYECFAGAILTKLEA